MDNVTQLAGATYRAISKCEDGCTEHVEYLLLTYVQRK